MTPQTAGPDEWARFLRPLLASVANPPGAEDFRQRVAAIVFALDVPRHMLTEWRQREAVRRFGFWPSVADLSGWLTDDLKAEREAMHRALPAPEPEAPRARTMDEILAVKAKAKAAVAEMTGRSPQTGPKEVKPAYLSAGTLRQSLEAMAASGNRAAATRLAAMAAKTDA